MKWNAKVWLLLALALAVLAAIWIGWQQWRGDGQWQGLAGGNGRIEATEIDIATRLAGRLEELLVEDGDYVRAGQLLARMQVDSLQAQRDEAEAHRLQAEHAVAGALAQVRLRESDVAAMTALVAQRESELDAARRRLERSETLASRGVLSIQQLDDDRARVRSLEAALAAAHAQVAAARAAVVAARSQVTQARATQDAMRATLARIDSELDDAELKAPRDGRVQYIIARPGEVLGAGGKVLNMVDLTDVYMTFFLPEIAAGRVGLGSEARIVLDAAPEFVVPARISFVASTAQFTPKTVETASERQKLMFRVKARVQPELLQRHLPHVKTGLPGVAWVKVEAGVDWPPSLALPDPAERP